MAQRKADYASMGNGDAKENITDPQESEVPVSPAPQQHPKMVGSIVPAPPPAGQGGAGGSTARSSGGPSVSDEPSTEWQSAPGSEHLDIGVGTAGLGKGGISGP